MNHCETLKDDAHPLVMLNLFVTQHQFSRKLSTQFKIKCSIVNIIIAFTRWWLFPFYHKTIMKKNIYLNWSLEF